MAGLRPPAAATTTRFRVLLVPDSLYWVTGTIAKAIIRHNPWIEGTVVSAGVLERLVSEGVDPTRRVDLVHFLCPYASRPWLPRLSEVLPCVTTHHHVSDWELQKHNLAGDAIMTDSREWSEDLIRRGVDPGRVVSVPPGVDTSVFRPGTEQERSLARRRAKIPDSAVVVGFFGKSSSNEYDRKGVDIFLLAAEMLRSLLPALQILLVGPGWREVASRLESAGIPTAWLPFVRRREELAGVYRALDFYWVTSRIEGGPVTLLEAMSSGVCSVTTPVGLAREIVRDGENAVLVPIGDAAAVARATARLVADPKARRRLSSEGRKTVCDQMESAVTVRRVADLYARAVEAFSARRGVNASVDVRRLAADWVEKSGIDRSENDLLSAVPAARRRRIRRQELADWAENLIRYQGEPREGMALLARAILASPLGPEAWRAVLRNVLPEGVVRAVVTRRRARASKPAAANARRGA